MPRSEYQKDRRRFRNQQRKFARIEQVERDERQGRKWRWQKENRFLMAENSRKLFLVL